MELNDFGKIANECWRAIPTHFPNVDLGAHIIMPNHVHGIIMINDAGATPNVGATQCVTPTTVGNRPKGPKQGSLGAIIGSFKSTVSYRINKQFNTTGIWQRNYYEHIIRNDREMGAIWQYIVSNPVVWDTDDENPLVANA